MAREMADSNDGVSGKDVVGDAHLTVYGLINPDRDGGISANPPCDDNRGINDGVVKSVFNSRRDMGDRFLPCTRVERVGIGEKGFASTCLDGIHDPSDKDRPDEGCIPSLPEVKFYGYQVISLDLTLDFSPMEKFIHFVQHGPFDITPEI